MQAMRSGLVGGLLGNSYNTNTTSYSTNNATRYSTNNTSHSHDKLNNNTNTTNGGYKADSKTAGSAESNSRKGSASSDSSGVGGSSYDMNDDILLRGGDSKSQDTTRL
jgi:hypothetical protein